MQPSRAMPAGIADENPPYARPGPYTTQLSPADEQQFQAWVKRNNVPFDPSSASDYDMRGWWKKNAGNLANTELKADGPHFSDEFKTPNHRTFSNESRYATPAAPHWTDNDQLVDRRGNVLADESNLSYRPTPAKAKTVQPRRNYGEAK